MPAKKQAQGKPQAQTTAKNAAKATSPSEGRVMNKRSNTERLKPGELMAMVLEVHKQNPAAPMSPTDVARKLGRWSGPVWLAQEALVKKASLVKVSAKPQRYASEGKPAAAAKNAASGPSSGKGAAKKAATSKKTSAAKSTTKVPQPRAVAAASATAKRATARAPQKSGSRR